MDTEQPLARGVLRSGATESGAPLILKSIPNSADCRCERRNSFGFRSACREWRNGTSNSNAVDAGPERWAQNMISTRRLPATDLSRIGEIDRSERIEQAYVYDSGSLALKRVNWDVPQWSEEGTGDHSVAAKVAAWKPWVEEGGTLFGAFDGPSLLGFAIYRPDIAESMAQFAVLHVSRAHRRCGVGMALAREVIGAARADGARSIYVSSAPTRGTVDFYASLGFRLTEHPIKELYELEPEDIHMVLKLDATPNMALDPEPCRT